MLYVVAVYTRVTGMGVKQLYYHIVRQIRSKVGETRKTYVCSVGTSSGFHFGV